VSSSTINISKQLNNEQAWKGSHHGQAGTWLGRRMAG